MAQNDEVARVRKVLYAPARTRKLFEHLNNIEVLMNLDPARTLPPKDLRVRAGTGPNWFYASGKVNGAVLEAADRCEKIAAILLDVRDDLAKVDFHAKDKEHLRAGLTAQASAWQARASVWSAPGKPNVKTATDAIVKHELASLDELRHVTRYLQDVHQ